MSAFERRVRVSLDFVVILIIRQWHVHDAFAGLLQSPTTPASYAFVHSLATLLAGLRMILIIQGHGSPKESFRHRPEELPS